MDKDMVIELGIKIAAKELEINPVDYAIDYNGVLKEKDLSGVYDPINNLIIVSGDWLETANNNEILIVVFHEMRHYYQKQQIVLYTEGLSITEEVEEIRVWKKEFEEYNSPFKSNQENYVNQVIEKDSIEFSENLIYKAIALMS
jgi:hypothetical protein